MEAMKVYQQWLADFADDPQTVADLKAIENDPAEIEDRFYRELEFSLSEIAAADEELGVGVAFEGLPEQNVGYAAYGVLYVARVDEGEGLLVGLWHAERVPGRMAVGGGDAVAVGVAWAEVSESGHVVGCLAASGGEGLACGWDADACGVGCVDEADEGGLQVCAAGPADVAAFGAAVAEG